MYTVVMYLSREAGKTLRHTSESIRGAFRVVFGEPIRTLPDGATLWHTPHTSWEWEEGRPLEEFLRSLDRGKGEVFEILFLDDASGRVVHEHNLRPDEDDDEKLGTKVSFTFMQEDFFKGLDKEKEKTGKEPESAPRICGNCHFWSFTGKSQGLCQLEPPRVVNDAGRSCWPVTYRTDWCGRFEGKEG